VSRVAIRICKGCRKWLVPDRKPAMGVLLAGVRRHRLRGARLHGTGVASSHCMETQGQIASGLPTSNAKTSAAIQFGMLPTSPETPTDADLVAKADGRVAGAKALGAKYLLLAQMQDSVNRSNYVALDI
jgi:hypothetical protein